MNKLQFLFQEVDSDESFTQLAHSLGGASINNAIVIPSQNGSGLIRKIKMEDGLHMRVWDFELNRPFLFDKKADIVSPDRIFHVAFIINPEALSIKTKGIEKEFKVQGGMNTLFVSNDIDIEVEIATEKGLHAIDVSFTSSWLLSAFSDADPVLKDFMTTLIKSATPTVFFETTSPSEYRIMVDVQAAALADKQNSLHIKSAAYSLLSGFFGKVFSKPANEVLVSKFFYHEKMLDAEKYLIAHLQKRLPCIDIMAKELALSESTLKRHFKLMFGKSIYEYYLELKMNLAKRLMMEQALSVNQVASMLEYGKVSNFISIFKKYNGFSPGSLRRKRA